MKLYRTANGPFVEQEGKYYRVPESSWDALIAHDDLGGYLLSLANSGNPAADFSASPIEAPIGSQEVWAAGVTYLSQPQRAHGGGQTPAAATSTIASIPLSGRSCFSRPRASRVAAPAIGSRIRSDANGRFPSRNWLCSSSPRGKISGYTIGNDMSSRDIEGENPLYLPQAKVYDRSCALGPCILVSSKPLPAATPIRIEIERAGTTAVFKAKPRSPN